MAALAAVVTLAAGAPSAQAQSTSGQLCSAYAARAVETFQQGQLRNCNMSRSGLSADYGRMFDKCRNWPNVRTQSETRGLGTVLQVACKAAAPRPAPAAAPGGNRTQECLAFTDFAMAAHQRYAQAGCPRRNYMHANRNGHYNWCLQKPPALVASDRALKQRGLDACLNGRPVP